jgi:hypothetical protein
MILNNNPKDYEGYEAVIDAAVASAAFCNLKNQDPHGPQGGLALSLGEIEIVQSSETPDAVRVPSKDSPSYDA